MRRYVVEVVGGQRWPTLPEAAYWGVIVDVQEGPAPRSTRRHRDRTVARERRAFVHVELRVGLTRDGQGAIDRYRAEHDGEYPVVYVACPFLAPAEPGGRVEVGPGSKLGRLMRIVGGAVFEDLYGWEVKVKVVTSTTDADGDEKPRQEWRSVARKVLAAVPPGTHFAPTRAPVGTRYQEPGTSYHRAPEESREEERGRELPGMSTGLHPRNQAGRQSPAGVEVVATNLASTPANPEDADALVARRALDEQEIRRRLRARFGATLGDLGRRGPCARCGGPTWARAGESAWCPSCDWRAGR